MVKSVGSDIGSSQAEILLCCFLALESVRHFTSLCLSFPLCENSGDGVVMRGGCDESCKERGHTPGTDPNLRKWHLCYYDVSCLTRRRSGERVPSPAPPGLGLSGGDGQGSFALSLAQLSALDAFLKMALAFRKEPLDGCRAV